MNNKNISLIGMGRLGICFALNLERKGYIITGVDVNQNYVDSINNRTLKSDEACVEEYLLSSKNINVTTKMGDVLVNDLIFILVATPSLPTGKYDHTQIENVINQLITFGKQITKKYLVINCTTMPGYCEDLSKRIEHLNYEVSYNPEFIAQGTIIKDQTNPDMVLIGESSTSAGNLVESVYNDLCESNPIVCRMTPTESEITKIALNCFLTTKITYANMVGDIALRSNCNPNVILNAIGSDSRVGKKYLKHGYGYGGPCFPRDNRAFGLYSEEIGIYPHISYSTDQSNKSHLHYQVDWFEKTRREKQISKDVPVVITEISYKPQSTILEESQQLEFALELEDRGYVVCIDEKPSVIEKLKKLYPGKFTYIS